MRSIPIFIAIAGLALFAPLKPAKAEQRTVTVNAEGFVQAEPDTVTIRLGVITEADTAQAALNANSAAMENVIAVIKKTGLPARQIQTSALSIRPKYSAYRGSIKARRSRSIVGYTVQNQVRLTSNDLSGFGGLIDKATAAGTNEINGITFTVSKRETLLDDARRNAIENAFRRGELYAKASRTKLGPVIKILETGSVAPRPYPMVAASRSRSVPIEAGRKTLGVRVQVIFALE